MLLPQARCCAARCYCARLVDVGDDVHRAAAAVDEDGHVAGAQAELVGGQGLLWRRNVDRGAEP